MSRSRSWISPALPALIVALLFGLPGPAGASPPEAFQQHYEQAMGLYHAEHYREAIAEFTAAYEASRQPRLLINIGRAHFKLGEAEQALAFYQRYLRERPRGDADARHKLMDYIAEARQALEAPQPEVSEATPAAAPPSPVPPVPPPEAQPPPQRPAPAPLRPAPVARAVRSRLAVAKWVVGGLGLLGAAAGAALLAVDGRCVGEIPLHAGGTGCARVLDSKGGGIAFLVAGGVALGGSALMFGLDHRRSAGAQETLLTVAGRLP